MTNGKPRAHELDGKRASGGILRRAGVDSAIALWASQRDTLRMVLRAGSRFPAPEF